MQKFLKKIVRSVYDPEFYKELRASSTWLSLRYFVGITAWVAFFIGLGATALLGPLMLNFIHQAEPVIRDIYPNELVVTIKSGTAASNVAEPYRIKMPKPVQDFLGATSTQSLAVIDTRNNAEPSAFLNMNTWALVAKDGIMVMKADDDKNIGTEFQAYQNDFVITHDAYTKLVDKLLGFGDKLPFVMLVFFIIGFFIWGAFELVYFIFAAILVYLLLKSRGVEANYGYSYRIAIHAATLPILINFVLAFATGDIRALAVFPFLFTIILLGVVWANLRQAK